MQYLILPVRRADLHSHVDTVFWVGSRVEAENCQSSIVTSVVFFLRGGGAEQLHGRWCVGRFESTRVGANRCACPEAHSRTSENAVNNENNSGDEDSSVVVETDVNNKYNAVSDIGFEPKPDKTRKEETYHTSESEVCAKRVKQACPASAEGGGFHADIQNE